MDFFTSIKTCFVKYIDPRGRASRSELWYFYLFLTIITFCADIMDAGLAGQSYWDYKDSAGPTGTESFNELSFYILLGYGPGVLITNVVTFLPSIVVFIRRLHDINKSGWWILLLFTIIGVIPLTYWSVKRSDKNVNDYGSPPLHISEGSYK